MAGYIIPIGTGRESNWTLARNNKIWALVKNYRIKRGDALFFWQAGLGLIAYARASSDSTLVTDADQLPWPDHVEKNYRWKFNLELLEEPASPVETEWSEIRRLLGNRDIPNKPALAIDGSRVESFIQLFESTEPTVASSTVDSYDVGHVYTRASIHQDAKNAGLAPGNNTTGITVVGRDLVVFWNPFRGFYANRWISEPESFEYSGEGNFGDMTETGGNRRLLDAEDSAEPVRLFYKNARIGGNWMYLGWYAVAGHRWSESPDSNGQLRKDIRFQFDRESIGTLPDLPDVPQPRGVELPTVEELWPEILDRAAATAGKRARRRIVNENRRVSDPLITDYVKARARRFDGMCELCGTDPGWRDASNQVHLQAHHIDPDIDLVDWVAALCGTCHDRMHHSTDSGGQAEVLRILVLERQQKLGRHDIA